MPDILLIDAKWDTVTEYLFSFRVYLLDTLLRSTHYQVHHLIGSNAVQPNVDNLINGLDLRYVSGAGHGLYGRFQGYSDTIIWEAGRDLSHLKGTIIHLLACQSGASLGRSMVTQGVNGFWGYTEKFKFIRIKPSPRPLYSDSSALSAIMMDCLIDIGILDGSRADQIYEDVSDYVSLEASGLPAFSMKRAVLRHNYQHLVYPGLLWGDPTVTL